MGSDSNNNQHTFESNHGHHPKFQHQQQQQQPLSDINAGNYANMMITSSPLKNSSFYFNDEILMTQNENISFTPIRNPLHDHSLQFLYHNSHPLQQIQQQQQPQQQTVKAQQILSDQDNNETDEDQTDDDEGEESSKQQQTQQHLKISQQQQQQSMMLQFAPTIQNANQTFQQEQPQPPVYYLQQAPIMEEHTQQPSFVHPMSMNMGVNMYPPQQQGLATTQTNLYPAVEYVPPSSLRIPESTSTNTISSFDSVPFMVSSSSVSDNSIASPASFSNNSTLMTPQRHSNNTSTTYGSATGRRTSVTMTPILFESPSRSFMVPQQQQISPMHSRTTSSRRNTTSSVNGGHTKSHRRSRSRLSIDPSGCASIITSSLQHSLSEHRLSTLTRSPSHGTNPFYQPHYNSSLISPHHPGASRLTSSQSLNNLNSPLTTPLATPGSLKRSHYLNGDDDDDDKVERLKKIASLSSISPNMLMTRSNLESVKDENENATENDDTQSDKSIKFEAQYSDGRHPITFPFSTFTNLDMVPNTDSFLCDPSNSEITKRSPLKSSPEKPLKRNKLARSQSSINLKSFTSSTTNNLSPHEKIITGIQTPPQSGSNNSGRSKSKSIKITEDHEHITRGEDLIKQRNLEDHPLIDRSLTYDKPIVKTRKSAKSNNMITTIITEDKDDPNSSTKPTTKTGKPKKQHPCPLCGVILQRPEHVKRHMNSHSSDKPFVCEEPDCGVRFNRKDNLRAHIRNIHHMNV